jgi:hypothetical protein
MKYRKSWLGLVLTPEEKEALFKGGWLRIDDPERGLIEIMARDDPYKAGRKQVQVRVLRAGQDGQAALRFKDGKAVVPRKRK